MPLTARDPETEPINGDAFIHNHTTVKDFWDQLAIDAAIAAEKEAANTSYRARKTQECSFPVCEPGRFYCDAESLPGKSYCATHHAATHRKPRKG